MGEGEGRTWNYSLSGEHRDWPHMNKLVWLPIWVMPLQNKKTRRVVNAAWNEDSHAGMLVVVIEEISDVLASPWERLPRA